MAGLHYLSSVTTPIEAIDSNGVSVGRATGFFYRSRSSDLYLVTNWHVVSARDPAKPQVSKNGAVPCKLIYKLHAKVDPDNSIQLSQRNQQTLEINSEDGDSPEWLEHPTHRHKVDVVAVKIGNERELEKVCFFGTVSEVEEFEADYQHGVMDDVFVIGYPWGLSGGNEILPLYKRGSIASEPSVDYMNRPAFLIDCRTSKGMSGSPVIVSHSGVWNPDDKMTDRTIFGTVTNFVGIYSGRLRSVEAAGERSLEDISEIGTVWKKHLIDEIVNNGVLGDLHETDS